MKVSNCWYIISWITRAHVIAMDCDLTPRGQEGILPSALSQEPRHDGCKSSLIFPIQCVNPKYIAQHRQPEVVTGLPAAKTTVSGESIERESNNPAPCKS